MESTSTFVAVRPQAHAPRALAGLSHVAITSPGALIPVEPGIVRGHGTRLGDGRELTATVAGVVERVNKLVAVRPLRSRYSAEVGDVVVGRVVELVGKRWKLDVAGRTDAFLLLSAVNLPGGVQRRRTYEDELNMRAFFAEGDLVSAEVQELWSDGGVALHTRSLRYGKLRGGQFVSVQAALVKRAKKHFHKLRCGVHIILGNNGYIFLSFHTDAPDGDDDAAIDTVVEKPSPEIRRRVARVHNAIAVLDAEFIAISPETIMEVYDASVAQGIQLKDLTRHDVARSICAGARNMREAA